MSKKKHKRNRQNKSIQSKQGIQPTNRSDGRNARLAFLASIISAIIVTSGTVYSVMKTTSNKIEYVESKRSEWDINNAINYFPLKKGNTWSYEGEFETVSDTGEWYKRPISMKMKVIEEVSNQDITLFGITNYFNNIDFFDYSFREKTNKELVIEDSLVGFLLIANEIYFVTSESYDKVKNELIRSGEFIDKQQVTPKIGELDILYRMPLFTGQRFGEVDQIGRSDLSYFWFVNQENEMVTTENNKIVTLKEYELIQKGLGFYEKIYLRPYLGVTAFQFHDVRTNVEMNLVSFEID